MSLINQMLRDLQQQKKGSGQATPETLRPKTMARVPYLPLPLVLTGATLILLFFIWWLAGALSDMMFGFDPSIDPDESQQVVSIEQTQTAASVMVEIEGQDQLTMAEREAEPPEAPVAGEQVVAKVRTPVNRQPVQTAPVAKAPVVKRTVVKSTPTAAKASKLTNVRHKSAASSSRVTQKTSPVKSRQVKILRKVTTKEPKRLHPDALPGAVLSRYRSIATKRPSRPSAVRATTPYGMAEEAFLDAKWARAQQRDDLAVRSLQRALELYPGHLPARKLLAEIFEQKGNTGKAMAFLAEGLEIAPDYIPFKKSYARLLTDRGDYETATEVLLYEGLPTVAEDPEAHVILASLYQHLGESFLAAQTYRNLLVAWPQTGAFWVGLGGALEGQKMTEEALECYRKALKTKNLRQDLRRYAEKRLNLLN